jgi:hypothetical protein
MRTVLPRIVQVPVASKLTPRPEGAVALTVNGSSPNFFGGEKFGSPKLIV